VGDALKVGESVEDGVPAMREEVREASFVFDDERDDTPEIVRPWAMVGVNEGLCERQKVAKTTVLEGDRVDKDEEVRE